MCSDETRRMGAPFYGKFFAVLAALLLGWLAIRVLQPTGVAVLWATILALMLWPLNERLRRRLHGRRGTAAMLLTLGTLVCIVGPTVLLGALFATQASRLVREVPAIIDRLPSPSEAMRAPAIARAAGWLASTSIDVANLRARAVEGLTEALEFLVTRLGTVFVGALGAVTGVALSLVVLFFVLRDGERMVSTLLGLVPLDDARKRRLFTHIGLVARGLVLGSLATAAAQGALVGVAFALVGLPSPVVFGVLSAVASVLPIGTAIVWVPATAVLVVLGRYGAAAFVLVWGVLVVSVVDNLIRPRVVSGSADVPTLMVFLGIIGGIAGFGLIGVFIGPIVLVTAVELARILAAPGPDDAAPEA
jgi:predicted PurR-regulated permease PerM